MADDGDAGGGGLNPVSMTNDGDAGGGGLDPDSVTDGGDAGGGGGGGRDPDYISGLPDELLLSILSRVPTVDAIRTCLVSPRWSRLWTHLPVLNFVGLDRSIERLHFSNLVDNALQRCDAVGFSGLVITVEHPAYMNAERFAAWLAVAAERVTGRFYFSMNTLFNRLAVTMSMVIEMPLFPKADNVTIVLNKKSELRVPGPAAGTFSSLTVLDLANFTVTDGGAALCVAVSSCCPLLRNLQLMEVRDLRELRIQSSSVVDVYLYFLRDLELVDVVAEVLHLLEVHYCFDNKIDFVNTALSLDSPSLRKVYWHGVCPDEMRFGETSGLLDIALNAVNLSPSMNKDTSILECFHRTNILQINVFLPYDISGHLEHLSQVRLPYCSELRIVVARNGHTLGASVAALLRRCEETRKLVCSLVWTTCRTNVIDEPVDLAAGDECVPGCVCLDVASWRNDGEARLDSLQELVLNHVLGFDDEHVFLRFVFEIASSLRSARINVARMVPPDRRGKIFDQVRRYAPAGCALYFSVNSGDPASFASEPL